MVRFSIYGQKRLFSGFERVFTAFIVLFKENWGLFFVNWWYGCQDTGKKVYLPALKLGLRHSPLSFRALEVIYH